MPERPQTPASKVLSPQQEPTTSPAEILKNPKDYLWELEFKGVGAFMLIDGQTTEIRVNQVNVTANFPEFSEGLQELSRQHSTILLFGTIFYQDGKRDRSLDMVKKRVAAPELADLSEYAYCYFAATDLLYLDGKGLRNKPLLERKGILSKLFAGFPGRYNIAPGLFNDLEIMEDAAKKLGYSTILGRKKNSRYNPSKFAITKSVPQAEITAKPS